jgi:glycolate oxidase
MDRALKAGAMSSLDSALLAIDQACGSGSVIRDKTLLEGYAGDESETTPCVPEAVVRASSTEEVSSVMQAAFEHGVPVTPRGGGTGRVGGAVPVPGGIVLTFERMASIKHIDRNELTTRVQPGVITGELKRAVEEDLLYYPPDPNSRDSCAIGGNLATNAGGPRAFKYGVTREYVLGMEVVLADGTVLELGHETKKGVTGYDLTALMVGSEGTLGIVTEATLRLIPKPEATVTLLACFSSLDEVAPAVGALLSQGRVPSCIELLDSEAIRIVQPEAGLTIPGETKAILLIELDGDAGRLDDDLEVCGNALADVGALEILVAQNSSERERLWSSRRELSHSLRRQAKNKLSEDVVVPRTKMADLLRTCAELSDENELVIPTYGHAGDGNLHVNFLWDDPDQKRKVDDAVKRLFERVIELRGTLSGEHGIGVLKAPYLPMEQSPALIELQQRIKDVFDPKHVLNPGKIFPVDAKRFHGVC